MSTFYSATLSCTTCRKAFRAELVKGIHISRLPHARQQIIDGSFQLFLCPHCDAQLLVESTIIYTDFDHHHYVAMEPSSHRDRRGALQHHLAVYDDCFVHAPPIAQELGRRMSRRLVFGLRALREKLLMWDARLDDRVVESLKGDWLAGQGIPVTDCVLRLHRLLEGGHLLFAIHDPVPPLTDDESGPTSVALPGARDYLTIPASEYQRRQAEPSLVGSRYPWLQEDWLVDIQAGPGSLYQGP